MLRKIGQLFERMKKIIIFGSIFFSRSCFSAPKVTFNELFIYIFVISIRSIQHTKKWLTKKAFTFQYQTMQTGT